ncbi:MAG: DUF3843 family protein [Bacteroidales bacterium]|nr:DUF3843 family protein [Bacteroidales bacterium]
MKYDKVVLQQWMVLKPYAKQVPTDFFYLNLSNKVKQAITYSGQLLVFKKFIDNEGINKLSCFLTSYLEDLISGCGIWNTFVRLHNQLYQKPVPFYDTEDYFEDEINPQDIFFLIWYYLNTVQKDKFISPFNDFIFITAYEVYDVFDSIWDDAPQNPVLKDYYSFKEDNTDFYKARNFIDNILFKTYLFYPDTGLDIIDEELRIIEEKGDEEYLQTMLSDNRDRIIHKVHTRLLNLTGKEWAVELLGEDHPLSRDYLDMSPKIAGYFLYKGQDEINIFIEHIASGREFNLTKKSFEQSGLLKEIDTIMYMGIVRWRGEWWFSGVFFQVDYNPDLVLDEKKSVESLKAVDFLSHQEQNVDDLIQKQHKAFLDFNNGHPIAFVESDKIDDFIKGYIDYFNASLKLSKKQKEKALQHSKKHSSDEDEIGGNDFSDISESGLVFFNPQSGVEIALSVNSAFPLPNNPFFNVAESEEHIMMLLMNDDISKDLVMYCIENCKSELPFFKEGEGRKYFSDIDFLLRFWKKYSYFSKPSISFTTTS